MTPYSDDELAPAAALRTPGDGGLRCRLCGHEFTGARGGGGKADLPRVDGLSADDPPEILLRLTHARAAGGCGGSFVVVLVRHPSDDGSEEK